MEDIVTDRLVIRRFKEDDWQDLYEYLSDGEVVRFEPYGVYTEALAKEEARRRSGDDAFYAVCLIAGGKLIGNLYLGARDFGTRELGYVFNRRYQGAGYAFESAAALIDYAFIHLGARRVTACCCQKNVRSWRLLERLHLRREGLLLQNLWFKTDENGEPLWFDTCEYAVLKTEWRGGAV